MTFMFSMCVFWDSTEPKDSLEHPTLSYLHLSRLPRLLLLLLLPPHPLPHQSDDPDMTS